MLGGSAGHPVEAMLKTGIRKRTLIVISMFGLVRPAMAGPPYVSDDPEPTEYKHFEIYAFSNGTAVRGSIAGASGVDFNYGAAPDLQLTATLPAGFSRSATGGAGFGLSNVELAAKYRFLHQDSFGLDVSLFPRVFLPSPTQNIGNGTASLLLPAWVQKDWSGGWSAFGGGGCVISGHASQSFCLTGVVVNYQLLPKLQLGVELFHQTADNSGTPATTSLGIGARYDIDDNYHLLGYIRHGIENTDQTDQYSWYASVLFTF
jgi:hypothetical protein